MTDYIKFTIAVAKFAPRVGLIPAEEFKKTEEYRILKRHSVDGILYRKITWTDNIGWPVAEEWSDFIRQLTDQIEAWDGVKIIVPGLVRNPRNLTKYNIIESFSVVEQDM